MSVSVKESSGVVTIEQIHSQAMATYICVRFQGVGIIARIGMLPGSAGYQVTVPGLDVVGVERILRELRIDCGSDQVHSGR